MEGTHQTEANRHKNYRLKQHEHVANLHEYCAERDAIVEVQEKMILKLKRNNKRLRKQYGRQRKLAAKRKGQGENDSFPQKEKESAILAALAADDIPKHVASDGQLSSVPSFVEDGKDKEIRADKPLVVLENLQRQVNFATFAFPKDVFQDTGNSDDTQQYWKEKFQEDAMSPNLGLNLNFNHAGAEPQFDLNLSPMDDLPFTDEDLFDGRLD